MSDNDIVERLREADEWMLVGLEGLAFHSDAPFDAADEVVRLRADNTELRALLKEVLDNPDEVWGELSSRIDAALKGD